jgi:hypothetical protein
MQGWSPSDSHEILIQFAMRGNAARWSYLIVIEDEYFTVCIPTPKGKGQPQEQLASFVLGSYHVQICKCSDLAEIEYPTVIFFWGILLYN